MELIPLRRPLEYATPQTDIILLQLEQCIAASGNAPSIEEDDDPGFVY